MIEGSQENSITARREHETSLDKDQKGTIQESDLFRESIFKKLFGWHDFEHVENTEIRVWHHSCQKILLRD